MDMALKLYILSLHRKLIRVQAFKALKAQLLHVAAVHSLDGVIQSGYSGVHVTL